MVRIGISGLCVAIVGLMASCGGGGPRAKHESSAEFADFTLVSPGVVFELHPANSPILMSAAADRPLKVCPVGTSFESAWRHGCRALAETPRRLPTTSGAIHVLFRVVPSKGKVSRAKRVSLQWTSRHHRPGLGRR